MADDPPSSVGGNKGRVQVRQPLSLASGGETMAMSIMSGVMSTHDLPSIHALRWASPIWHRLSLAMASAGTPVPGCPWMQRIKRDTLLYH